VNMLQSPVKDLTQVQLQVRVAEVNRNRIRDLGSSYALSSESGVGGFRERRWPGNLSGVTGGLLGSTFSSLTSSSWAAT